MKQRDRKRRPTRDPRVVRYIATSGLAQFITQARRFVVIDPGNPRGDRHIEVDVLSNHQRFPRIIT